MFLNFLFRLSCNDSAIDLGTADTLICARNKGVVQGERSMAAMRKDGKRTNKVLAVGRCGQVTLLYCGAQRHPCTL